jgi:hypothetical protein
VGAQNKELVTLKGPVRGPGENIIRKKEPTRGASMHEEEVQNVGVRKGQDQTKIN